MRGSIVYGLFVIIAMLAVQSEAKKCYDKALGDIFKKAGQPTGKVEAECAGYCVDLYANGKINGEKVDFEAGGCEADVKENIILASTTEYLKYSTFKCDSNLCNAKGSSEYNHAMTLQNAVDNLAQTLKGKSTKLKCHENDGKSADCETFCLMSRQYSDSTVDKTEIICGDAPVDKLTNKMATLDFKESIGHYGAIAYVKYGKKKETSIVVFCSTDNCNKESALDKKFADILEATKASGKLQFYNLL